MRTIHSILTYNFTPQQKTSMIKMGIINGCGGEGKNIEKPLRAIIEALPGFDAEKSERLFLDILEICYEHDYEFYMHKGFYASNFRMAKKVYKLLKWAGWRRILVAFFLFYFLSKYGKPFYS